MPFCLFWRFKVPEHTSKPWRCIPMFSISILIVEQFFLYLPVVLAAFISFSILKIPNLCLEAAFLMGALFSHVALTTLPMGTSALLKLLTGTSAGILGGMTVGLLCGVIITHGRIAHLLANIITAGICSGIALFLLAGPYTAIGNEEAALTQLPIAQHPELIIIATLAIIATILCGLLLTQPLGRSFIVYGNNPLFFEQHHISVSFVLISGIAISNAFAGLSGFFVSQTNGFIDINGSVGIVLLCLTALVLGKRKIRPSSPFIIGQPIIGLLLFCCLQQLLISSGIPLKYFMSISSLLILAIIVLTRDIHTRSVPTDQLGV